MRHFCRYPISDKQVIKTDDHRLSRRAAEVIANNFRSVNLSMAVDMIHHVERRFDIIFTDYTFQMLAEYIAIALSGGCGERAEVRRTRAAGTEKWIRNDRA